MSEVKLLYPHEKPWCICKLGTSESTRIVRRYANRQDAEDDLRIITRFVKTGGQFVIAFDVVEAE